MNRLRNVALVCLLLTVAAAGGCTKDVVLTFSNTTPMSRALTVTIPGEGPDSWGVLGPNGGQLSDKIKIPVDDLPAIVNFRGGDQTGSFTVNDRTPDKLYIDFTPDGPQVRKEKDQVIQVKETRVGPVRVEQDTIVE